MTCLGSNADRTKWISRLVGDGWRMAVMSLISLFLGYALTVLFHHAAGFHVNLAYALAVVTCSVVNFFGCRSWVFQGTPGPLLAEAGKFFSSILFFRALEIIAFSQLARWLDNYHAAYFVTACIAVGLKFLAFRVFVFKRQRIDR